MNIVSNMALFSSRRDIFGVQVCDLGWTEIFGFVAELSRMPVGQTVISFMNANNANLMLEDPHYREVVSRHLVLPDGYGVDLASMVFHGRRFPANLNGTDFVPALMTYMSSPMRIGLIGARPDVLEKAVLHLKAHAPWHDFIAVSDGYIEPDRVDEVMANAESHKLDIMLVAMGTPRQEKWIDEHVRPEHARLVVGVGALFDFLAGEFPRAPLWMRRSRLEWLYRMAQEPKRLWHRYVIGIPLFFSHLLRRAAFKSASNFSSLVFGIPKRLQSDKT